MRKERSRWPVVLIRTALLICAGAAALAVALTAQGWTSTRVTGGSPAVVKTAFNKTLKRTIVVDGRGRTLYIFTADIGGKSACTGDCRRPWPAFTSVGKPAAGKGINPALLDITPDEGQVRYNHHPLYLYRGGFGTGRGDRRLGDVEGQALFQVWYVLSPRGIPIRR